MESLQAGLTVYDVGLHRVGCGCHYCHYIMEFDGRLQQQQMAKGLRR